MAKRHASHAELLYSGVDGAHDSLIPLLIGVRSWEQAMQAMQERREAIAARSLHTIEGHLEALRREKDSAV